MLPDALAFFARQVNAPLNQATCYMARNTNDYAGRRVYHSQGCARTHADKGTHEFVVNCVETHPSQAVIVVTVSRFLASPKVHISFSQRLQSERVNVDPGLTHAVTV